MNFALIDSGGVVQNTFALDDSTGWTPPPGWTLVENPNNAAIIGGSYANGVFSAPQQPAPTVQQQLFAVDALRDQKLRAGFVDTVTGKTWACDDTSIGRWTAMAANAQPFAMGIAPAAIPVPTFQPIATDNTILTMSALDIYSLFAGRVMPFVSATVIYARTLKDRILAGNPPADITQGWP